MATIKAFTDLSQSKKLAEILPLESADMSYIQELLAGGKYGKYEPYIGSPIPAYGQDKIPCWSLAALLGVLPFPTLSKDKLDSGKVGWMVSVYPDNCSYYSKWHDFPIDACCEMILKLNELRNWKS